MQVVGGVTAAWGGIRVDCRDRLEVEVVNILNVSVSGIFLYANLTTCIPASWKEVNLKSICS